MKFDKLTMFFNDKAVAATTASTETASDAVDFRLNGDVGDCLKIYAQVNGAFTGTVKTKVQTSWDKSSWTDISGAKANAGNVLYAGEIPTGVQRYVRLVITGELNGRVTAGLVDEIETSTKVKVQSFPPLEDLTA